MELSERDIDLIDKYLTDEISMEERQRVEERIDADAPFAKEVKVRKEMITSIKVRDKKQLRDELKGLYEESKQKPATARYLYWVAASVAIIVTSFIFLFYPSGKDELFNKYYQPFPEPPVLRGSTNNKSEAMLAYSKGQYQEALTVFTTSLESSDSLDLYIGNCLLNLNKAEKAKEHFFAILKGRNESLKDHAQWYLALSYIKLGNTEKASQQLDTIIRKRGAYHKLAQDLQSEI